MLKRWMSRFMEAQERSETIERRAMEAERQMRDKEREMLEWASAQVARRDMAVSGMY